MINDSVLSRVVSFGLLTAVFGVGLTILAVRLRAVQVEGVAEHRLEMSSQSQRIVQTAGLRGRIVDRNGVPLAANRLTLDLELNPEAFKPTRKGQTTSANILAALADLERIVGRPSRITPESLARHLRISLARPLKAWTDLTDAELARFSERSRLHPGFSCVSEYERTYPQGSLAAHLVGRVGREELKAVAGDRKANYAEKDLIGREGLELQYDAYLRGMSGQDRVLVDARGFAVGCETLKRPSSGYDLTLTLDVDLQRAVEAELDGLRGACVALDPRDGSVLALASAPAFDPNDCVPVFTKAVYQRLSKDEGKPLLNRATAGLYAPGSTFKPVTGLAGLRNGWSPHALHPCDGMYRFSDMRIRCARTWGHGELDLAHALRESCNPYFCNLGLKTGVETLKQAANDLGLGARTGIDFPNDPAGVVPDPDWKMARYHEMWYPGDLAQMSIGQGMLLVTPLQMARVVAAIGTGLLATPRLNAAVPPEMKPVPFTKAALDVVREGLRLVVDGGTGRKAGEGVEANVIGKTGTAEVGRGERRRKNTWFIAYATPRATSRTQMPIALAMIIENGESGGGTTAPKVASVLRAFYNQPTSEEPGDEEMEAWE